MSYTLQNIIDKVIAKVRATDITDAEALSTITDGINAGYMILASTVDKRLAPSSPLPYTNPLKLPIDAIAVVEVKHSVEGEFGPAEYRREGDYLFFNTRITGGTVILMYAKFPPRVDAVGGIFDIKDGYVDALIAHGAYAYQLYTKTYTSAQLLLEEFNGFIPQGGVV